MQIQEELIHDLDTCPTDYERDLCEELFIMEELITALFGLQTGKSLGSDGLLPEFYSALWDDLSDSLRSVLNECYNTSSLISSQREALLLLLYKTDDQHLPKYWRPISLLNTDHKMASKIITALSTQVRKCKDIKGFLLPGARGLQFKIYQYADDTISFV